jgi:2-acylglycerol O-acyltransferase 2
MYLASPASEGVFLRKRLGTVRLAIQEGASIVPVFFFGNSRLFSCPGGGAGGGWLAALSRRMRASIVLFYGRWGMSVPYRHPISMVTGQVLAVTQRDSPSDEEVQQTMDRLVKALEALYEAHKPQWEDRPLVIH